MIVRVAAAAAVAGLLAASMVLAQEQAVDPGDGYVEPGPEKAAPKTGPDRICPMTDEKVEEAVAAFSRMMPALSHPRCSNCHGAVNPFTENGGHAGGQIKIENMARRWLDNRAALVESLSVDGARPTDAAIGNAETALRTILSADSALAPDVYAELLLAGGLEDAVAAGACSSCHEHSPVRWRIAKSRFAGLKQKELCESFQKHKDVTTPAEFVDHMSRDPLEFIPVAFAGTRALTPLGKGIYAEVRGKPYAPEPVPMAREALNRAAFDWGTALGGKYKKPASCGCEKKKYFLDMKVTFDVDYDEGAAFGNVGVAQAFRIPVKFVEEGKFTADVTTPVKNVVDGGVGADMCAVEQDGEETWALKGAIDPDTNEMSIAGTVVTRMKGATMKCVIEGKRITQPVPGMEQSEDLEKHAFKMPALVGERRDFRAAIPYGERIVSIEVVEE